VRRKVDAGVFPELIITADLVENPMPTKPPITKPPITPIEERQARLFTFAEELRSWAFDDTTLEQGVALRRAAEHCTSAAEHIGLFLADDKKLAAKGTGQ
jgi:hypothetical protein